MFGPRFKPAELGKRVIEKLSFIILCLIASGRCHHHIEGDNVFKGE